MLSPNAFGRETRAKSKIDYSNFKSIAPALKGVSGLIIYYDTCNLSQTRLSPISILFIIP